MCTLATREIRCRIAIVIAIVAFGAPSEVMGDGAIYHLSPADPARLSTLRDTVDLWGVRKSDSGRPVAVAWLTVADARMLRLEGFTVEHQAEETAAFRAIASRLREPAAAPDTSGAPGTPEASGTGLGRGGGTIAGFPCYRTVEQTFADLQALTITRPDLARFVDIGDSWEKLNGPGAGFEIPALVIGRAASPAPKSPLVIIAAMHARELATAELATRFAESLVNGYGVDPDITWLLDHREIHIVPQLNPDGRKRAESGLSWRKNVNNGFCADTDSRGIDLNRNSTFFWGGPSSSGSQCSLIFRGPSAASEPETTAIEAYMGQVFTDQRGPDLDDAAPATAEGLFISIHSFSELVLFPWEGVGANAPNHAGLRTLARRLGFSNNYHACQDCLGAASGTAVDAAYGEYGVAAFTYEIGTSFFQSCAFFEGDILPGNLPSLTYAAKASRRPYQAPAGPEVTSATIIGGPVMAGVPVTLDATADDTRYGPSGDPEPGEPTENVVAVGYTIGDPPWAVPATAMSPVDGGFDSTVEDATVSIDTTGLGIGRHLVYVVATDAAGHVGVPTATFLDIVGDPIFADGFESGGTSAWSSATP